MKRTEPKGTSRPSIPKFVTFIVNRLRHAGHEAWIVGGAVRDICLARSVTDWDVATSASSSEIKRIFEDTPHFALKHDTVTLLHSQRHFDVTPFRRKTGDIDGDLAHRDFTINAMAYNPQSGKILDPHGGRQHLALKRVKAVGLPEERFDEDPLRLLRAVRLAVQFRFRIESATFRAIGDHAMLINKVAPERIREELMKILMTTKPSIGFSLMRRTGLLREIIPELLEGYRKRQEDFHRFTIFRHALETVDRTDPSPPLRVSALLHDVSKPRVRKRVDGKWRFEGHEKASAELAREIMVRLRFSSRMVRVVTNLIAHHGIDYHPSWSDGAIRRFIRQMGRESVMDLFALRRADTMASGGTSRELKVLSEFERRVLEELEAGTVPELSDLAIGGTEVMEILGIPPGPEVGEALGRLLEKVTDHPELNTRQGLLSLIEEMKIP